MLNEILESLSPLERKVVPFLNLKLEEIIKKSGLDETSIIRALKFLENKNIIKIESEEKVLIDLGTNGIYYKKNHLPERRLLMVIEKVAPVSLEDAKKESKLSENEFKASLGVLKNKALIALKNGKIVLSASKEEISKKSLEEQLLEILPIEKKNLEPEHLYALKNLEKRKDIIETKKSNILEFQITPLGSKIAGKKVELDLIEEVTPEIIKSNNKKKFRRYDIHSAVPSIQGGKKHFVKQAIEYGKSVWLELGFEEMSGPKVQTSFWNFDALFTAQDHPVRELQDTFYLKGIVSKLPDKKIVNKVKECHESGVSGSKGWQYQWNEEDAKRTLLRTHTTCLSAHTLSKINLKDLPKKFFSVGRCFRNETVDWSHGFEFNQTEGIVVDEKMNFRHLLGYLKEFFKKMGFEEIRFAPAYFPYTEPSVEIHWFHPEKKVWLELGGAGIFRPEITVPLLGKHIPVLAWGPGFDRALMDYYKIKDLRTIYENDLKDLRNKKYWIK